MRVLLAAGLCLFVLSCKAPGTGLGSELDEIGGDPDTFGCATAFHQYDKFKPKLDEAIEQYKTGQCGTDDDLRALSPAPGPARRGGGPVGDGGVSDVDGAPGGSGLTDGAAAEAAAPPPLSDANKDTPACRNLVTYIRDQARYVHDLHLRINGGPDGTGRRCVRGYRDNDGIVIEHATCGPRGGCDDVRNHLNGTRCWTCRYRLNGRRVATTFRDARGNTFADPDGRITCQTQQHARDALEIWCDRHGVAKNECIENIDCREAAPLDAEVAPGQRRVSGEWLGTGEYSSSTTSTRSMNMELSAGIGESGVTKKINVTVATTMDFTITVSNLGGETTFADRPEAGREAPVREGHAAQYSCAFRVSRVDATEDATQIKVGMKLFGIGSSFGEGITATESLTHSRMAVTQRMTGAGLTEEQMIARCLEWGNERLDIMLRQYGVLYPSFNGNVVERDVRGLKVQCNMTHFGESPGGAFGFYSTKDYPVHAIWTSFNRSAMTFRFKIKGFAFHEFTSATVSVPNDAVAGWRSQFESGEIRAQDLANFITHQVAPRLAGRWRTASCSVAP